MTTNMQSSKQWCPTNLQSVKQWCFEKIGWSSMTIEKAVDVIVSCFTTEQMQILDSTYVSGETASFRDLLLANNDHKTPKRTIDKYCLLAKSQISFYKYMFDQKDDEIKIRQVFCEKFSKIL